MQFNKNNDVMLAIGMFSLTLAILLERFIGEELLVSFFIGLFTGLSLVMNLGYLIKFRSLKISNLKKNQKQIK